MSAIQEEDDDEIIAEVGRQVFLNVIDAFAGGPDEDDGASILALPAFVRRRALAWAHAARQTAAQRRNEKATAATMKARC